MIFPEAELFVIRTFARNYGLFEHVDLASTILTVVMMDGYMNRKSAPPPGHAIIWRGYACLHMRVSPSKN